MRLDGEGGAGGAAWGAAGAPRFPASRATSVALWCAWWFAAGVKLPGLEPHRPEVKH